MANNGIRIRFLHGVKETKLSKKNLHTQNPNKIKLKNIYKILTQNKILNGYKTTIRRYNSHNINIFFRKKNKQYYMQKYIFNTNNRKFIYLSKTKSVVVQPQDGIHI